MINIERNNIIYKMSKDNKPVAYAKSGDTVTFHTFDCFKNQLLPENAKLDTDAPSLNNPTTGPLYIDGALPGDTLKVEVIDIEVGALGIGCSGPSLKCFHEKLEEFRIKRIKVNDGMAEIFEHVFVPIEPMIGVIGVAPLEDNIPTALPGNHGGNMDCKQIKKGAVLYLPVLTEGALLAIGDLHALMGDGEVSECGLEIEGKATVKVTILPKTGRTVPAVYVDDKWITIASCKTLDEAAEEATRMMFEFLTEEVDMDAYDAGMLLSLTGNLAVCQNCNSDKTMRMELPLSPLMQIGFRPS